MKHKRWIILGAIILLFFLIIPIPTGTCNDGGTRVYTALSYKIVNWNRLLGEDKIYSKTSIYSIPMNFWSIDELWEQESKNLEQSDGTSKEDVDPYDFEAQYIRTSGYHEEIQYPKAVIIRSVEELQKYYQNNKSLYFLERITDVSPNGTIGFLDACDRYDEAYFEDQILILVLLQEASGSTRHEVTGLQFAENGKLEIKIKATTPEAHTTDLAVWHLMISPSPDIKQISESNVVVRTYSEATSINQPSNSTTEESVGAILPNEPDESVSASTSAVGTIISDDVTTEIPTDSAPTTAEALPPLVGKEGEGKAVSYQNKSGNISVTIPKGWLYEISTSEDDIGFSINCWPKGATDGKMHIEYSKRFGVCGTDLKQEYTDIGEYRISKGTYGQRPVWQFIRFLDVPGNYVVSNGRIEEWWESHGEEAMQIIETIRVGDGLVHKKEAIEIAKPHATVNYNSNYAIYNSEKQAWDVSFVNNKTDNIISQSVTVDIFGEVIYVEKME